MPLPFDVLCLPVVMVPWFVFRVFLFASWFVISFIAWSFFLAVVWFDVVWSADLISRHDEVFFHRWICWHSLVAVSSLGLRIFVGCDLVIGFWFSWCWWFRVSRLGWISVIILKLVHSNFFAGIWFLGAWRAGFDVPVLHPVLQYKWCRWFYLTSSPWIAFALNVHSEIEAEWNGCGVERGFRMDVECAAI